MTADELLAAVEARIRAFEGGDSGLLMGPEAVAEANDLLRVVADGSDALRAVAWLHWLRYQSLPAGEDQQDLESAMAAFTRLASIDMELVPEPLRPYVADRLAAEAVSLLTPVLQRDDPPTLNRGIHLLTAAVAGTPIGHPDRATHWFNLGYALRIRFARTGVSADLDAAVDADRKAVDIAAAAAGGHPDRSRYLSDLGLVLGARFERNGALADADAAVDAYRQAVDITAAGSPGRAATLSDLGRALRVRFGRTAVLGDLDAAVDAYREAANIIAASEPDYAEILSHLGLVLRIRFERTAASADLDASIIASRKAIDVTPAGHPDRPARLSELGIGLQLRFGQRDTPADLDAAVAAGMETVEATPAGHPDRADRLSNLGNELRIRFERTGVLADIDAAVVTGCEAIDITPDDHPRRPRYLANLGLALRIRFERTNLLADLNAAVDLCREATDSTPIGDSDRPAMLSGLGIVLQTRFGQTGALVDVDAAVDFDREAVRIAALDHPDRAMYLSNLGAALCARFERVGDLADLDEAIDVGRQAVDLAAFGHPDRGMYLSNLGIELRIRFLRTGALADIDAAVDLCRQAVDATPDGHPNRARHLNNVAVALEARFERTAALADLDAAVDLCRLAIDAYTGLADRGLYLTNLSIVLQTRFGRSGMPDDLDEAVNTGQQAVDATPDGHPSRAKALANLSGAQLDRFESTATPADLEAAIATCRQAVDATPSRHQDRARYLANLGNLLRIRGEQTGVLADLDAAIASGREAVDLTPTDHSGRGKHLSQLGMSLQSRYDRTGTHADLREAARVWEEARGLVQAPVSVRISAARAMAAAIAQLDGPARAVDAYRVAVELLPLLADRGIGQADRQHLLNVKAGALVREAAGAALAAGETGIAVEWLEAGRGVFWSQLRDTRTDLTGLAAADPDLASRLAAVLTVLGSREAGMTTVGIEVAADPVATGEQRRRAAAELEPLLAQIRALPATDGFPHPELFFRPTPLSMLLPPPGHDPIVIINVSRWGCDALILTTHGPTPVRLDVTEDQIVAEGNRYLDAMHHFGRTQAHTHRKGSRAQSRDVDVEMTEARPGLERSLTATLQWLWDAIAEPILHALNYTTTPHGQWPRLWWCPTGALTIFPIHAAGDHTTANTVMDRVISSYTPTVRALHAFGHLRQPDTRPGTIAVLALPHTPDAGDLPGAAAERDLLVGLFPAGRCEVFTAAGATRAAVLDMFDRYRIVHACCHGTQDLDRPATGGLLPYDWRTAGLATVTDLTGRPGGEFAFLSACKTATGGVTQLDEVVSVASALNAAGWRHVIGTLWSIWDDTATTVTTAVYPRLIDTDGRINTAHTARILHETIRILRDDQLDQPSTWAPFIHIGP